MIKLRKWLSVLTIMAFVVTTTMAPSVSRAMPHNDAKNQQTQVAKVHDCHGHGEEEKLAPEKSAQNDKDASDKCCDGSICKCVGGTCHNGLSQILGNGGTPLFSLTVNKGDFNFADENINSALPSRLKRPPKA